MSLTPIFTGHVTDAAQLLLTPAEEAQRRRHLQSLAGRDVEVIVRRRHEGMSGRQRKYLHAVVFPLIAEAVGDSIEGVKFDLMGEKFGWHYTRAGHRMPVKAHTSEMTVEETTEFVEWVGAWASSTLGITIPLPTKVTG